MDKNLTLTEHLSKTFKKASSRVKLLGRIRHCISPDVAETIYKSMILPTVLYCSNTLTGTSTIQKNQLEHIQSRALEKLITNQVPSISYVRNKRCALEVFKCLNGLPPCMFPDYFMKTSHSKETHGNNINLVLPRVPTEIGWKAFAFQGSVLYNQLSSEMKQ